MINTDILIRARWIVPIEPDGVLENHAIAIQDGRVIDVASNDEIAKKYRAHDVVDLPHHVLIPGLINAHTHAAMSLFRGLADDLPLMDWLQNHIWPAEAKWVNPDFVRDGTELAVIEMLKSGTTCFSDMYFFPEDTARVCLEAGMRAVVGLILIDFPTAYAQTADEYLHKAIALHDDLRAAELVTTAFAPHAPYTVSDEPLTKLRTLNDELNLPLHMHVHETEHEVVEAARVSGKRPLARLADLNLLQPNLVAVHMTQLTDAEIETLARSGANVVHCPASNLKLASGFCPVDRLLKSGVNVALGTDGAASNDNLDLLGEMRIAALLAKAVANDATALPAHQALRMATLNGAKALGIDDRVGSIEPGKAADLTAIDLSAADTQPVYNPISQLVYSAGREQVTDVWINGKQLLANRRLTTIDETAILRKAQSWREKIAEADR